MIECQYKRNGLCQLATDMAKTDVPYYEKTCERCAASPNPMAINKIVKGLAASALVSQGDMQKAGQILKNETWAHSKRRVTGVGSVLSSIFKTIGIVVSEDCSCKRHAVEMDRRGTRWCLDNLDKIVGWLEEEAKARELVFFRAGVSLALYGLLRAYLVFEKVRPDKVEDSRVYRRQEDEWAVVVTAAPRAGEYTLAKCLHSIIVAGWSNPVVFAEPGIAVPDGITTLSNPTRRGCFHNWLHSAKWALENTKAEMILCVQDDSLFHPDSRQFTEDHCLWPSEDTGVVSLYTASHYQSVKVGMRDVGINEVHTNVWWGTCAVVWKRVALEAVVNHEITKNWLGISPQKQADEKHNPALRLKRVTEYFENRREQPHLINNSDYVAGHVLNLLKYKKFFIDPSPVAHISKVSTINHGGNGGKRNCKRCADHSVSLVSQVGTEVNVLSITKQKGETAMGNDRGLRPVGEVNVRPAGPSVGNAPRLMFQIRSSYSDPIMSRYRWGITRNTLIPSLAAQTNMEFDIQLISSPSDQLRDEKLKAFSEIAPTTIAPATWYNQPHDGRWRRTSRVDDDDMISVDFAGLIIEQPFDGTECLFVLPNGYVWADGESYLWKNPQSQFVTLQSNTRMTPYSFAHQYFRLLAPSIVVSDAPHWMWVRHYGVLSGMSPGSTPKTFGGSRVAKDEVLFPYNYDRIQQAMTRSPEAEAYIAATKASTGRFDKNVLPLISSGGDLTSLADLYKTDKGVNGPSHSHQYSLIYEELFSDARETVTNILELGVGPSLLMWQDYFPIATIHGVDKKNKKITGERIVTYLANTKDDIKFGVEFDLIVDDASHKSTEQREAFNLHRKNVKCGGYYVIESLHAIRVGKQKWCDESPSMLDTCRGWVSVPPVGWSCNLYGDQLCILRRLE